jgi:hypothetical protein
MIKRNGKVSRRGIARGASTVTIHGILAGLALCGAYLTWTRDKTQVQTESVVALNVAKSDVQGVSYVDENRTVLVERQEDAEGKPYAWVTVTTKQKTIVTPPAVPAPAAPPPPAPATGSGPAGAPPAAVPVKATPAPAKPAAPSTPPGGKKAGEKAAADKDAPSAAPSKVPPPAPTIPATAAHGSAAPASTPAAASPAPAHGAVAPPPPVGGAQAGAPPPPAPPHEIKETITTKPFRGNEAADKLLESFAPLSALRALGKLDEAKAKELGLSESKKTITLRLKSGERKFSIGNASYGAGDLYVRDDSGQVFLLASRFASDFEYAESRLMERRLHRFERGDISRVEVTVGAKKRVLVQGQRQDPAGYFWAEEATKDKKDDALRNWMDKVLRIAINDFVAKGDEPKPGAAAPSASGTPAAQAPKEGEVLSMRFFDGSKPIGQARFSRYMKGSLAEFYAVTETTVGTVRLLSQTAESAVQDAEKW